MVFTSFLCSFTSKDRPLVLFFDDLQFADSSSLHILQLFITNSACHNVFFILAYRSDEVDSVHPLSEVLTTVNNSSVSNQLFSIHPLEIDAFIEIVTDTLKCSTERAEPLAVIMQKLSGGNPFHAVQLLRSWYHRRFITYQKINETQQQSVSYNVEEGNWQIDYQSIQADQSTDEATIQQLLTQRLLALPDSTLTLLQLFGCIAFTADESLLCLLSGLEVSRLRESLQPSISESMIRYELSDRNQQQHSTIQSQNISIKEGQTIITQTIFPIQQATRICKL